ncbi:MAG: 5-formyltetrahydrofolate cyclo-ligase [Candidatus Pelagibacter sp. TMED64]|nr:5-formyltetrahydrofolate cyclo-ligase [Candidatus Pelagibacter sp.]OUU65807.1 MAG: 5-formyltetrahydrofolate cyclo-ligase [Candidatus Pelagibacter sp. TMED64]|tara:strand:+ start:9594 stop:10142 length:549 start_codon:yes stop_codon:yes gene_type:complete
MVDKNYLRKKFINIRKKNYLYVKEFSFEQIIKKFFLKRKLKVGGYYPSNYEVNLLSLLKKISKKKLEISLPVIEKNNNMSFKIWKFKDPLNVNKYGILEPNRLNKKTIPDIFFVPLVAYDKDCNRLGYGKGYYDKYLSRIKKIKKNILTIGIAYSFQEHKDVLSKTYDFKLDYIYTEKGLLN